MNLLLVDDEMIAVKGMMNGVDWKACGIDGNIWTAYSARSAMQILMGQQVDIMLCDIEMPGSNGITLLREALRFGPEIKCIFLTCHANFEYAQEAISLGCSAYILKPAAYEEVEAAIRKVCDEILEKRRMKEMSRYYRGEEKKEDGGEESFRSTRSPEEIVKAAQKDILENLSDGSLLISDVAERLSLNKDYLNRVFKKEQGISMNQYLIQERMKLAGLLLEDPRNTINDAAERVGYNNYPYFASSFKRYYGCSPMQYKKEHQKSDLQ